MTRSKSPRAPPLRRNNECPARDGTSSAVMSDGEVDRDKKEKSDDRNFL